MTEAEERLLVVEEAKTWIGTPYHFSACIKGAGVDCAQLLIGVYSVVGRIQEAVGIFTPDWYAHAQVDTYLMRAMRHARKLSQGTCYKTVKAEPGDIVLTKAARSRVYNHAGIVIAWPKIIHAVAPVVQQVDASAHPMWAYQQIVVLDPWKNPQEEGSE